MVLKIEGYEYVATACMKFSKKQHSKGRILVYDPSNEVCDIYEKEGA